MKITPFSNKADMGRVYISLAIQYGRIELKKGLLLYTANALYAEGNSEELKFFFPEAAFFFKQNKKIFECTDPTMVIDCMENDETGIVLPIVYSARMGGNIL